MLRAMIVDDEAPARSELRFLLEETGRVDAIVEAVRPYWEAGFTDVALVQIGGDTQEAFLAVLKVDDE